MRYFNHDTNATSDELMVQLRLEHGAPAIDLYWAILEYLYGEEKPLAFGANQRETKSVLFRLCLGYDDAENYVKTMVEIGLLNSRKSPSNDFAFISSSRADEAIEAYHARAESARQNGKKGGRPRKANANRAETKSVSQLVSETNQSEKLTKTKNKRVGSDKPNQTLACAASLDGEPPREGRWKCSKCGSTVIPDGEFWHCPRCMTVLPEGVEFEEQQQGVPCPQDVMEAAMAALAGGAR